MLEKIKENKRKIIIASAVLIVLITIIVSVLLIRNSRKNNKLAEIAKAEEEYGYNKPYIPEGFTHTEGTWDTGFVIKDNSNGNEFVWIPIDGTTVTLQRRGFSVSDIDINNCSEILDEAFSESVEKYEGYYVARYEAGVPDLINIETEEDLDINAKPVSQKGKRTWNYISYTNAQTSAEQMYATKSEITSSIMNSYAYDTMLTWLEASGYNVETDSKDWGNYTSNSSSTNKVENAGSNETWKANNIYDLAGNVSEWTSEQNGEQHIYRGGSYYNDGNITPAGMREAGNNNKTANNIGFRPIMYKTGNPTIEGYDDPYVPDGFTHTEGEWNNGFVIREDATGNEFVWIPVDGYNLELDRNEFEKTFTSMGKSTDKLEFAFKLSVYTYGGYYVGRYEAGIDGTSGDNVGVPVSKKGVDTWTNISRINAKQSAEKMYESNSQINSRLMNSYAYDTMLNWLTKTGYSQNTYNVSTDSKDWGNYKNNSNALNAKAQTGTSEAWKANNIYDLAGNIWEWTTENYKTEGVARGGDYLSNGDVLPAGTRDNAVETSAFDYTGFRVIMYQKYNSNKDSTKARVAAAKFVSSFLDNKGNLWAWGYNGSGQLGDGTTTDSLVPIQIMKGTKFINIASDYEIGISKVGYSMAIDEEGNLWTWGYNKYGQLGDGTTTTSKVPKQIMSGTKFKEISAGDNHSMAIDEEGNLWTWGYNNYGQLGDGTTTTSKVPKQIMSGTKFEKIENGRFHSVAIDEEGNLWTWGWNNYAQLGDGTTTDSKVPKQIMSGTKFKEISGRNLHSMAIDEEGKLWTWGWNYNGQLGDGTTTTSKVPKQIMSGTKFKEISAGCQHCMAIDEEGNLWTWGYNNYGQLGDGTTTDSKVPKQIMSGMKFKEISAGYDHSMAIDEEGNLWTWGYNSKGQLGDGTTTESYVPIKITY